MEQKLLIKEAVQLINQADSAQRRDELEVAKTWLLQLNQLLTESLSSNGETPETETDSDLHDKDPVDQSSLGV